MSDVLVLGGAGLQGAPAAKVLAGQDGISRVIVADRHREAAERVAAEIGDQAVADVVDAHDSADLKRLLEQWRPKVVLNCVGPFRSQGAKTLSAALEAGAHYVDLLDDAESIPGYLALDEAARAAGLTAIFGVGFTPGLTNIMARHLSADLDAVDQIHWSYVVNTTLSVAPHLMTHRVQMFGRDAKVVDGGELISIPGGSRPVDVEWKGVGTFPAVICTHPEPFCAGRYYGNVQHATIRASYTAPEFTNLLATLGNAGWEDEDVFASGDQRLRSDLVVGDFLSSEIFKNSVTWSRVLEAEDKYGPVDGVRAAVSGMKDGKVVRRVAQNINRKRWFTTHGVAAIGATLVARGEVTETGVHSADVFDPAAILPALQQIGIVVDEFSGDDAPEFTAN